MRIVIFLLLIAQAGVIELSRAAPKLDEKKEYYLVSGDTADEIWDSLRANSPNQGDDEIFVGRVYWKVDWDFWWNESGGSYHIEKVATQVKVKYVLPRLQGSDSRSEVLEQKWQTFQDSLLRHENGHRALAVRAAEEIEEAILSMGERPTSEQLEQDANQLGESIIRKYNRLDKAYDRRTNHGVTEGVSFP